MLRQYGSATPSSLTPILHPEDAQPNERTHARSQKLPPRIQAVLPSSRGLGHAQRGGHRGRPMYRGGGPFTQHAIRGSNSWRGRGRDNGSYRGAPKPIRKPVEQHRPREGDLGYSSAAPIDVDAIEPSPLVSSMPSEVIASSSSTTNAIPTEDMSLVPPQPPPFRAEVAVEAELTQNIPESLTLPQWLLRSKSPSPKLPPTPLKRRKLDSDDDTEVRQTKSPRLSSLPVIEAIPAIPAALPPTPRFPSPATLREQSISSAPVRTPTPSKFVKQERISPVKVHHNAEAGPSVKNERRSPSLPPHAAHERRLITESAQFYPLPEPCRKSNPQFAEERRAFFRKKVKELLRLGLRKTKAFWRDDGLVIEWLSDVPVWSDTLKADIPNLATAIERAYALNESTLPRAKAKRKKSSLPTNDATPERAQATETPGSASSQPTSGRRRSDVRTPVKHWATGIPLENLQHDADLLSPSAVKSKSKNIQRPALPTRQPSVKPSTLRSNLPRPPFRQPDPSAAIPSQEWRTMRPGQSPPAPVYPSKRMIFKPMNPRKTQTVPESSVALPARAGEQTSTQTENGRSNVTELPPPMASGHDQPVETEPKPLELLSHLSPTATPKDAPTSEPPSRSPTLVNESLPMMIFQQEENLVPIIQYDPLLICSVKANGPTDEKEISQCDITDVTHINPELQGYSSEDEESIDEAVEGDVQEFISKYASMFDADRHKLKKAYSKDALFSCRVHHTEPYSCASLFVPESKNSAQSTHSRASASQVIRGRTHICDRLLTLGQYQFIPRGVPQNPLYTWSIPKSSGVPNGILLSLHGEVVKPEANPALDHRLTVDQTFLLRQRMEADDTDDHDGTDMPGQMHTKNFWPLTIVSHQMTVRSNPLLNPEALEELIPWAHDILS